MNAKGPETGRLDRQPIVSKIDRNPAGGVPAPEDNALNLAAQAWLQSLPFGVRPRHIQVRFPRIANTLSLRWNSEKLIRECFKALLNPQRAFRIPFPPLIEEELRALAEYRGLKEPPTVSFDEFLEAESETAALAAA